MEREAGEELRVCFSEFGWGELENSQPGALKPQIPPERRRKKIKQQITPPVSKSIPPGQQATGQRQPQRAAASGPESLRREGLSFPLSSAAPFRPEGP